MRAGSIISVVSAVALTACASVNAVAQDQSYPLERGVLTYDALQRAGETCKARGGTVKPTGQGSNRMLSNYYCSIPAGAKAP